MVKSFRARRNYQLLPSKLHQRKKFPYFVLFQVQNLLSFLHRSFVSTLEVLYLELNFEYRRSEKNQSPKVCFTPWTFSARFPTLRFVFSFLCFNFLTLVLMTVFLVSWVSINFLWSEDSSEV
jgi:hypothetical protein